MNARKQTTKTPTSTAARKPSSKKVALSPVMQENKEDSYSTHSYPVLSSEGTTITYNKETFVITDKMAEVFANCLQGMHNRVAARVATIEAVANVTPILGMELKFPNTMWTSTTSKAMQYLALLLDKSSSFCNDSESPTNALQLEISKATKHPSKGINEADSIAELKTAMLYLREIIVRSGGNTPGLGNSIKEALKSGALEAVMTRSDSKGIVGGHLSAKKKFISDFLGKYHIEKYETFGIQHANVDANYSRVIQDEADCISLAEAIGFVLVCHHENYKYAGNQLMLLADSFNNRVEGDSRKIEEAPLNEKEKLFLKTALVTTTSLINTLSHTALSNEYLFNSEDSYLELLRYGHVNFDFAINVANRGRMRAVNYNVPSQNFGWDSPVYSHSMVRPLAKLRGLAEVLEFA